MIKKLRSTFSYAFAAIVILMLLPGMGRGQTFTATYNFASVTTTSGTTDPTAVPVATGLTFGSFNSSIGTNPGAAGRFSFTGWPTGATNGSNTFSGSINTSSYYTLTITPTIGYSIDINSITFTLQRSGTGIRQYVVRSSLDYNTNLPASISPSNANLSTVATDVFQVNDATTAAENGSTITLGSAYDALTSAVTFRFYGFNSEAAGGTFSIDNVVFSGVASGNPAITLNNTGFSQISGDAAPTVSATKVVLSKFKADVTTDNATLNTLAFKTACTYVAADISKF